LPQIVSDVVFIVIHDCLFYTGPGCQFTQV
jgi:hypothetical protein